MINIAHVSFVFKSDSEGLAVPEFAEGSEWLLDSSKRRVCAIMLDGWYVKLEPSSAGIWTLKGYDEAGQEYILPMSGGRSDYEKAVLEAYDRLWQKLPGIYVVYGRGVCGNPYKMSRAKMVRISPCNYQLLVPSFANKAEFCKLSLEKAKTPQELFNMVQEELRESPQIVGLMFQEEGKDLALMNAARVLRVQFGLEWPPRSTEETVIVH